MPIRITLAAIALLAATMSANATNVVEVWDQVSAPPAPKLSATSVKASESALLLLDIEPAVCNQERKPRCIDAVPAMAKFLDRARKAQMAVFYSNIPSGSRETILPPVSPRDEEPIVKSSVNKFFGTKLDDYLKAKNVKTVIVCGTTSIGAALYTASAAAQYGYKIVLPVDCVPGASLYEEQVAVWSLINGPGTARVLTASTLDMISIE